MKEAISQQLMEQFQAHYVKVVDESHKHAGHQGVDRVGNTHFDVTIVSDLFNNEPLLKRQRRVNQVLRPFIEKGVHALSMVTKTKDEFDG